MNDKSNRVIRGGSWYYGPQIARVAFRGGNSPGFRDRVLGIRLVEVIDDPVPVSKAAGSFRVCRGGGWGNGPRSARVASRLYYSPGYRDFGLGLRLVEVIDDPAPAATTSRSAPAAATSAPGSWK